jgi:hypothetical protein
MKIHKYICDLFDVFTGFSTFFLQYVQKNIQSTSILQKELMWVGCHKWKLQDINFMILTDRKRLFTALKDRGMNTIRLVWVNPNDDKASGHCSKEETVVMALRAQKMGIMIDFHYSDSCGSCQTI